MNSHQAHEQYRRPGRKRSIEQRSPARSRRTYARSEFKRVLSFDVETRSDINLKVHGALRYAVHPSTRVLMLAWRVDNGPVEQWECHLGPMPKELLRMLKDPYTLKTAFNYSFERLIMMHVLGIDIPIEEFEDTMALAFQRALPGNLKELSLAVGKKEYLKDKRGDRLIQIFCKPRQARQINAKNPHRYNDWNTHPAEWEEFLEYNKQDVVAESAIRNIMLKYPVPESERDIWILDQHTNHEGVPINLDFVNAAWEMVQSERALKKAAIEKLTGLQNGNSPKQLLFWLKKFGYPFDNMKKESIEAAIRDKKKFNYKRGILTVLRLRQAIAKTSVNKYKQILDIQWKGRICYAFQYGGAQRTLRWSGRKPQFQNLPSRFAKVWKENLDTCRRWILEGDAESIRLIFGEPLQALSACIRTVIEPPAGYDIVCSDLGSIESRGVGEIACCKAIIDTFEKGRDVYKEFAAVLFKKAYEQITKEERDLSKPPVLGSGFGLGAGEITGEYPLLEYTGLIGYAKNMGVKMTLKQAEEATRVFRELYKEVVYAWYAINDAALRCVETKQPQRAMARDAITGEYEAVPLDVWFDIKAPFLRMRLPSGRHIYYLRPRIHTTQVLIKKGERKGQYFTAKNISYEGYDDKKRWRRVDTRGAKFLENWVQAWARDIMAFHMVKAAKAKVGGELVFTLLGSVHDELITMVKHKFKDKAVKWLTGIMHVKPPWHRGICLSAEGFTAPFYQKV